MNGDSSWYRILDHTADLAVLVRAPTIQDLYDAATRALFDVILDVRTVEPRESVPVVVSDAADAEDLIVRYLGEVLFLHDARDWLFRGARVEGVGQRQLVAHPIGERFDPTRHRIERQVKAVTYHELLLSEDRDGWTVRFVLDL